MTKKAARNKVYTKLLKGSFTHIPGNDVLTKAIRELADEGIALIADISPNEKPYWRVIPE